MRFLFAAFSSVIREQRGGAGVWPLNVNSLIVDWDLSQFRTVLSA